MALPGITEAGASSGPSGARAVVATTGVLGARATGPRGTAEDSGRVGRWRGTRADDSGFHLDQSREPSSSPSRPERENVGASGGDGTSSTAFLAQFLAQDESAVSSGAARASQVQAGISAYERAGQSRVVAVPSGSEVLPPSGSALASGHSLDLAV